MLVRRKLQENQIKSVEKEIQEKKRTIENQRNSIDEVHVQKELKKCKIN